MSYRLTFGRKFLSMLLVVICLMTIILVGLIRVVPSPITASVLITYGILITTMGMMYVGGNVWNKWVKSKYFQQGILDGDDK